MRIAIVTVSQSVHTRVFVEYLVSRGHEVTVITDRDRYEVDGVRTVNVRPLRGRRFMLPDSVLLRLRDHAIARELAHGGYDVVNVQMFLSDGIAAALASPWPVVTTLYGSDVYLRHTLPAHYLERYSAALNRSAVIHACSQHMAEALVDAGADAARIEVFQYGVDPTLFRPVASTRPPLIVSSRALRPLYRVHLIVEAMPHVLTQHPEALLEIYDTGSELERIAALIDSLGIADSVQLKGRVGADDLATALGNAAVWASMAQSDGTPLSLLEAMAAGAFPVVANLDTLHEWLSPSRAELVDDPTPASVGAALSRALSRAQDGAHVARNRAIVEERGNRCVNLARFEQLLISAADHKRTG